MSRYSIISNEPHLTVIEDDYVRMFLIKGHTEAVLFDVGDPDGDLASFVKGLTKLPVTVVVSHGHHDHVGVLDQFDKVLIHKEEEPIVRKHYPDMEFGYLEDGDRMDLGGIVLKVLHVPGHTPGGLALFDEETKMLYAADMLSDMSLYMFMDHCSFPDFIKSMDRFEALGFKGAYTSHGTLIVGMEAVEGLRTLMGMVIEGKAEVKVEHKEFTENDRADTVRYGKYSMHI